LNIEADAELGMPLDLVGIPGVMDGDERGTPWSPANAGMVILIVKYSYPSTNATTTNTST
jgi:hypothetical protein